MRFKLLAAAVVLPFMTLTSPSLGADDKNPPVTLEAAERLIERAAFAEASRTYAAFARDFQKDPRAPRAFANAVVLNSQLHLVDLDIAESDLQHFENTFVPVNLDLWAEMAFTLIDGFTVRNDRRAALSLLHRTMAMRDQFAKKARKDKHPDWQTLREIEVRTRGRLARAYSEMGDHRGADAEYARMQKVITELQVWPGKKPPKATAKVPETMDFIAETFFHFAEEKRFEAERMPLPAYLGNGDRDSVLEFVNNTGKRWYEDRKFAVKEAHRHYAFVLGIELPKPIPPKPPPPSGMIGLLNIDVGGDPNAPLTPFDMSPDSFDLPIPSPKWAIAAAERVGFLWTNFVRESLRMPIPNEWKGSGLIPGTDLTYEELKGEYIGIIDPPSEGLKSEAKHAYRLCLELSIQHRIVNEHTRRCIEWLSKNYGWEYHEIDDFAPPGERIKLGLVSRPAPLPQFTH